MTGTPPIEFICEYMQFKDEPRYEILADSV